MKKETLDRLHEEQVKILDVVHKFCQDNNLKYYLIGGTLLGAVRHKGFIPWDDDIDIGMPRKDYEILLKTIVHYLGDKYFLQTCYTDSAYGRSFAKIRINNTIFLEQVDCNVKDKHHGIFLDIFPLEDSSLKISKFKKFKRKLSNYIDSYIICKRTNIKINGLKKILTLLPMKYLLKKRDRLLKGEGDCYYLSFFGTIPKDKFDSAVLLPFEGKEYFAPIDYDYVLTTQYGDYMTLPPIEKRVTHNPVRISFDISKEDTEM